MSTLARAAALACMWALAAAGLAWAAVAARGAGAGQTVADIGRHIQIGDSYPPAFLAAAAERAREAPGRFCDTGRLGALLFIELRLAEAAIAGDEAARAGLSPEERLRRTVQTATALVQCAPQNAFAWLALAWSEGNLEGFGPRSIALLRRSYESGPHEAWIAPRRNLLAIRLYDRFPAAHRDMIVEEWLSLVRSLQVEAAAVSLIESRGELRERLMRSQHFADERGWRLLARRLDRLDTGVVLPGGSDDSPVPRPWR